MTTLREAHLDGMTAATSSTATRQVPAAHDTPDLRDAWFRGFDEMQQALGTWSPALPTKAVRRGKKVAKADPEPTAPPVKKSMMAVLENSQHLLQTA